MATTALAVVTPAAAQAADTWLTLKVSKEAPNSDSLFMAIRGGVSAGAGADALVWTLSKVNGRVVGDQQWKLQPVGYAGQVWIRNAGTANQFALSVKGNSAANGTPVVQWWFDATNLYQRWLPIEVGTNGNYTQFENVATGKCLAVEGGGAETIPRGARLILWNCTRGLDQQWADYLASVS